VSKVDLDGEISERARELLAEHFSARGRFPLLERLSGISSPQWQNFYYGKQRLNDGMLQFLRKHLPHDEIWLLTGKRPPERSDFPFDAPIPNEKDCRTVGQRLNWVIREFASPKGTQLFSYLEQRSEGKIPADAWADVVLGMSEPTVDMVVVVCQARRLFTEWVIHGSAGVPQVDPTNKESVSDWVQKNEADWNSFVDEWEKSSKKDTSKRTTAKSIKAAPKKHGNKKG
jgi:hypothetical protein